MFGVITSININWTLSMSRSVMEWVLQSTEVGVAEERRPLAINELVFTRKVLFDVSSRATLFALPNGVHNMCIKVKVELVWGVVEYSWVCILNASLKLVTCQMPLRCRPKPHAGLTKKHGGGGGVGFPKSTCEWLNPFLFVLVYFCIYVCLCCDSCCFSVSVSVSVALFTKALLLLLYCYSEDVGMLTCFPMHKMSIVTVNVALKRHSIGSCGCMCCFSRSHWQWYRAWNVAVTF